MNDTIEIIILLVLSIILAILSWWQVKERYKQKKKTRCRKTNAEKKEIESLFPDQAVKRCIDTLEDEPDLTAAEAQCGYLRLDDNTEVQVKIRVTRSRKGFLKDFEVEKWIS